MTSTTTNAGRAVGDTVAGGARSASAQPLRAASRQLLATAGNQVLKIAVDRAVGKVDQVAGRLDTVASGERRKPRPPASTTQPKRPAEQRVRQTAGVVKVKVGAAFNLVVQQALRLLQLVQRLAQQLLAAIARLFRRGDELTTLTTLSPRRRPTRRTPIAVSRGKRPDQTERPARQGPERPRTVAAQPAQTPQTPRRQRPPRPAAREAGDAPRRVAGDRPVRAARND